MSENHLMVDLETLGIKPGSAILSIGAVIFDPLKKLPNKVPEAKTFYQNIEIKTSMAAGFTLDKSTVDWWKKQSKEAQDVLKVDKIKVQKAFLDFRLFFIKKKMKYIWSHGSSFDVVLLEEGYRKIEMMFPWKFWDIRDTLTIFDLAGTRCNRAEGTHHYALDDAINQARSIQEAYKIIKGGK